MSITLTNNNETITTTSKDQIAFLLQDLKTLPIPDPLTSSFEEPKRYGNYTRLEEGQNILRILSEGIMGVEYWTEETDEEGRLRRKPIRQPLEQATSLTTTDWSYFYAFFVWNYKAQKIQIFSTAKRGIIKGLKSITKNPKWGQPTGYDICITKIQTDPSDIKSVEYTVTPEPKDILDPEIKQTWENSQFNRNALLLLFVGKDPFELRRQHQEDERKAKEAVEPIK